MLEIDECLTLTGSQLLLNLFAGDEFARPLQQHGEYLDRMALYLQLEVMLVEFAGMNIQHKRPEVHPLFGNKRHTAPHGYVTGICN